MSKKNGGVKIAHCIAKNAFSILSDMSTDDDINHIDIEKITNEEKKEEINEPTHFILDNSWNSVKNKKKKKDSNDKDKIVENNDNDEEIEDIRENYGEREREMDKNFKEEKSDKYIFKDNQNGNNKYNYSVKNKEGKYFEKIKNKKYKKYESYNEHNNTKEIKKLFDSSNISEFSLKEMGDDKLLNSVWYVWLHSNAETDWSLESYKNIYTIDSIGNFWRFFNNFHLLDKLNNNFFIMRNHVTPIWEDVNNRSGGICSIKIDFYNKGGRNDIGSEIMVAISLLLMNESFVPKNDIVNGISYSIKNRSIMIKLWIKNYTENEKFTRKLPINFLNKIDQVLKVLDNTNKYGGSKISIQYKEIIPEYNV